MTIELSFDLILDLQFLFAGRFPMALKERIDRGEKIHMFVDAEAVPRRAIKDSGAHMSAGLSFLSWAFLLQVIVPRLEVFSLTDSYPCSLLVSLPRC